MEDAMAGRQAQILTEVTIRTALALLSKSPMT